MFWKPELKRWLRVTVSGPEGDRAFVVSGFYFYGPRDGDNLVSPSGEMLRVWRGDQIRLASGEVLDVDGFMQALGRLGYLVEKNPEKCAALRRALAERDMPRPGFLAQTKSAILALVGKQER